MDNIINITASLIGIAGFALSTASWIYTAWNNRKHIILNFDYKAKHNCSFSANEGINHIIAILIENKSNNPIAITYISLICVNGDAIMFNLEKSFVSHNFTRLLDTDNKYYEYITESVEFPIELCSYGAIYKYVKFVIPQQSKIPEINYIRIMTNRGEVKIINKHSVSKFSEYIQNNHLNALETAAEVLKIPAITM